MGVGSASSVVYRNGTKAAGIEFSQWQVDEVHPGCSRVKERLEVLDDSGIFAQIVYPNVLGFAGQGRAPMRQERKPNASATGAARRTRDARAERTTNMGPPGRH